MKPCSLSREGRGQQQGRPGPGRPGDGTQSEAWDGRAAALGFHNWARTARVGAESGGRARNGLDIAGQLP